MKTNIDHIIELYQSGLSLQKIADIVGVNRFSIERILRNNHVSTRTNRRPDVSIQQVANLFNSGVSVKEISRQLGIARSGVSARLVKAGIPSRNRSESMYLRMSQTSFEEKQHLTNKANKVVRDKPGSFFKASHTKGAITKSITGSKVGYLEDLVYQKLKGEGLNPIPQFPVDTYNIDIACGSVAIEIHNSPRHPHTDPRLIKRMINLTKAGWIVIYVKVHRKKIINDSALNKIAFICELPSLDPPVTSKYWVINSTGETISNGSLNSDNLSLIEASVNFTY